MLVGAFGDGTKDDCGLYLDIRRRWVAGYDLDESGDDTMLHYEALLSVAADDCVF